MPIGHQPQLLGYLHRLEPEHARAAEGDHDLLGRFMRGRNQGAFEALLRRHLAEVGVS